MKLKISLDGHAFRQLVSGKGVQIVCSARPCWTDTALSNGLISLPLGGNLPEVEVEVTLQDIGFHVMRDAIEEAENRIERGNDAIPEE